MFADSAINFEIPAVYIKSYDLLFLFDKKVEEGYWNYSRKKRIGAATSHLSGNSLGKQTNLALFA